MVTLLSYGNGNVQFFDSRVQGTRYKYKDLDVPTKVLRYLGRTSTGAWEQFWPVALPATTSDSHGYLWELNPGSLDASPPP